MPMTVPQIKALLDVADEQEYQSLERALAADTRKGVINALASARKRLDTELRERERIEGLYRFEESFLDSESGLIVG
ncbi:MAG: ribonuclease HII, partial [Eggerthellaceae bacterium]|nr:ribonuclease HII [Eggerthellaceae bacterium]